MVKFKCMNCGHIFLKFCDVSTDSLNVECPKCGSHWVERYLHPPIEEQIIFPKLPYGDRPVKPIRYWCLSSAPLLSQGDGW